MAAKFKGSAVEFAGKVFEFSAPDGNLMQVDVYDTEGTLLGTPIRFKDADGRIAADFPGVDNGSFITNGEHGGTGSITNG
jgi:hypothetical protein